MLKIEEAEAILGPLSGPPSVEPALGEQAGIVEACVYAGERGTATVGFRRVRPAEDAEYAMQANLPPDSEPVSGLGDQALWSPAQGVLSVRRGGLLLAVTAAPAADGSREHA